MFSNLAYGKGEKRMFKCKPERSVKQTRILLFACVFVTLVVFLAASLVVQWGGVLRFLGLACLVTSILLLVKYTLTEMEYTVDGTDFLVTKIVGNKRTVVCCVDLSTAIGLYTKEEYKRLPGNEKAVTKYVLNQNIKANSVVYLCEFNGKRAMIEFEPNAPFVAIMEDAIKKAKENKENE